MRIFYSAKINGFFPEELQSLYKSSDAGWPVDAVEITQSEYNKLMLGRDDGKAIIADDNGKPILTEPVVDWQDRAEFQRQNLLTEASSIIEDWRTELQLDIISDDDKASLIKWMDYIKNLRRLDFVDAIDQVGYDLITWPDKPC